MPLATALIVAAVAYQAQKKASDGADGSAEGEWGDAPPRDIAPGFLEGKASIELLPLEQSLTMLEWPISTVSFYRCAASDDGGRDETIGRLEQRARAVLRANPWLGGWLVRGRGVGSFDNTPRLWYDPSGEDIAPTIFRKLSHDDVPLNRDTPYLDYERVLPPGDATVKTNPEIVNRREEPLFRITVVPSLNEEEVAIIVSMSHILGDGHTYYRLHNMLLGGAPVVPLTPQRELLYSQKVMELMGRQEAHYVSHITTDPAWMKLFRLGSGVNDAEEEDTGSRLHGRVFLVNRHWIGNIKASRMTHGNISDVCASTLRSPMSPVLLNGTKEDGRNRTHSTNDILVSWFWNLVRPHVGLMAVNFRGRVDAVGEDHAGNYANPIPYTREDYGSAALIRSSLKSCRRSGTEPSTGRPTALPRPWPDLTFSVVSNWSSFPQALGGGGDAGGDDLGASLLRHLPIISPGRMTGKMPRRVSFLVIFSGGRGDVGCVLVAPGRVMEEIDSCGVVKEMIAEF